MTANKIIAASTDHRRNRCSGRIIVISALAALAMAPVAAYAAGSGATGPSDAVSFDEIPGSLVKRVILSQKAYERLGIDIGEVGEATIVRRQMVGGRIAQPVEAPPVQQDVGTLGGFGCAGSAR